MRSNTTITTTAALCAVAGAAALTFYSNEGSKPRRHRPQTGDTNFLELEPFDTAKSKFSKKVYIPYAESLSFERITLQIADKFHLNPHYIQIYASSKPHRSSHHRTAGHSASSLQWQRIGSGWYADYVRQCVAVRRKMSSADDSVRVRDSSTYSLVSWSLSSVWDATSSLFSDQSCEDVLPRLRRRSIHVWGQERQGDEIVSYRPHDSRRIKFSFCIEQPLLSTIFEDPTMDPWNLQSILDGW